MPYLNVKTKFANKPLAYVVAAFDKAKRDVSAAYRACDKRAAKRADHDYSQAKIELAKRHREDLS